MTQVRFLALYDDGTEEPFDVPQYDLRNGAHHRKRTAS